MLAGSQQVPDIQNVLILHDSGILQIDETGGNATLCEFINIDIQNRLNLQSECSFRKRSQHAFRSDGWFLARYPQTKNLEVADTLTPPS
jgi:hypothetical protein